MKAIIQLLRIRQWVKNFFVLAPLFFGAELFHFPAIARAVSAFVIFCLVSSAVYIFNDWRDVEADRQHVKKRLRPLPSGAISAPTALGIMAGLLVTAGVVALFSAMPPNFLFTLGIYIAVNVGYSLGLKQISLVELFLVSSGFVLRLIAGGFATGIELSSWIVAATLMVTLLLTVGKRRGDIAQENDSMTKRSSLAQYNLTYLDAVLTALVGATLVVYLLFCVSDYAVIRFGQFVLVTAIPVTLGLLRYLQLVMVGGGGDSPTDLVLSDAGMIAVLTVFVAMFAGLIYS